MRSFAVALIACLASAKSLDSQAFRFANYIAKYGKSYDDNEEFEIRFEMWQKMDKIITDLNETETTSTHGHNHLSDWTNTEKSILFGLKNIYHVEKEPERV